MSESEDPQPGLEDAKDLLRDGFGRIRAEVPVVLAGLTDDQILWRADPSANHIGWLIWHLTRQQDDQVAAVGGVESVWQSGWVDRLKLPYSPRSSGYGMSPADVGAFPSVEPALLTGYQDAVADMTLEVIDALDDFDRVVDRRWTPPVTAGVRLVSVVEDCAKHLGQAEFIRGMLI